jgi:hypothetical protein
VDKTDLMVEVMYRELDDFHNIKEEFVKEFSQDDFDWIVKVRLYSKLFHLIISEIWEKLNLIFSW